MVFWGCIFLLGLFSPPHQETRLPNAPPHSFSCVPAAANTLIIVPNHRTCTKPMSQWCCHSHRHRANPSPNDSCICYKIPADLSQYNISAHSGQTFDCVFAFNRRSYLLSLVIFSKQPSKSSSQCYSRAWQWQCLRGRHFNVISFPNIPIMTISTHPCHSSPSLLNRSQDKCWCQWFQAWGWTLDSSLYHYDLLWSWYYNEFRLEENGGRPRQRNVTAGTLSSKSLSLSMIIYHHIITLSSSL